MEPKAHRTTLTALKYQADSSLFNRHSITKNHGMHTLPSAPVNQKARFGSRHIVTLGRVPPARRQILLIRTTISCGLELAPTAILADKRGLVVISRRRGGRRRQLMFSCR